MLPSSTTDMSVPRCPREKIVAPAGSLTSEPYPRMLSIIVSVKRVKAISGRKAGKSRRADGSVNGVATILLWVVALGLLINEEFRWSAPSVGSRNLLGL